MAALRYLDDNGQLRIKQLEDDHLILGRAAGCHIALVDDAISREHFRLDREADGRVRIRDLGSRNKTHVNGELITEAYLSVGDIIRAGGRVLEYLDDGVTEAMSDTEFLTPDKTGPPDAEWIKVKSPLSLTIGQLEHLSQLTAEQAIVPRPEDMAESALGQVLVDLQAERGFIALRGDRKTDLRVLCQRGLKRPAGGALVPVSEAFALSPVLQGVGGRYPQSAGRIDPKLGFANTGLIAPLTFHGDVIGVLYVDRPTMKKPFPSPSLPYAMAAGAQIGSMLGESARQLHRLMAKDGAAYLANVRRLQTAITEPPQSNDVFQVASRLVCGRARCGDFVDVVHVDEQRSAMWVLDGGGFGTLGIGHCIAIRSSLRTALSISDEAMMDPAETFNAINTTLAGSRSRQIVPCTFVAIDLAAGRLSYINAGGMPPLVMVAPGRLITLDQPSLVLGVDPDYTYEITRVDLPEVFRVVCYTDGVTEAANGSGETVGDQRLHEVLLSNDAFVAADPLVDRIHQMWVRHLAGAKPDDDALVAVLARG